MAIKSFLLIGDFVMECSIKVCSEHPEYFKPIERPKIIAVIKADTLDLNKLLLEYDSLNTLN